MEEGKRGMRGMAHWDEETSAGEEKVGAELAVMARVSIPEE